MSILYTYGTGSLYESKRWDNSQDLLDQLQDNNANLIYANHVRDAVFTLWERISDVNVIAASAASASSVGMYFQNSNPTPITVGGISAGSSFSTPQTIQQMFDALLYPYVSPGSSISSLSNREYGSGLSITLNWTATKNSNPITSIVVDGQIFAPTGNTQTGTKIATGTYSTPAPAFTSNSFIITVGDGTTSTTNSTSFQWMNKIYWGTINLSSIGNPNLTLNPGSASLINITSSTVLGLTGAGVSPGNQLASSKSKTYSNINGSGNYLLFAWPSSVSGATTPIFTVNGLLNTAFTNVKTAWSFTNTWGFTTNYEVWISNTLQNSPLNITIS
jgi:hypothetical protein